MNPVSYSRASSATKALQLARQSGARLLGGGTNLVDLMRKGVERPSRLVDVTGLSNLIELAEDGGLSIGAGARNSSVAAHPAVQARYPMLARAILSGASGQIRNMATVGGNLMQRTRCLYFNDEAGSRCNKRAPGSGCGAADGFNRYHAILGGSSACVATHPSDMCVALAALDARVKISGANGVRVVPMAEFHLLPADRPDIETALEPGELIVAVELPPSSIAGRSAYRKVRDRASYAFALVSVAAGLTLHDGRIEDVRIAFGGVAPKPWRASRAEAALRGERPTIEAFDAAADQELAEARPLAGNAFKLALTKRTLTAVLAELAGDDR
jgi:xanthine dehydrogenase YagS FAD-binding subunit